MISSSIPQRIKGSLQEKKYSRGDKNLVSQALGRLGGGHLLLQAFFEAYEGPFWSEYLGYELLDIADGSQTIETSTVICRNQFGFPPQYFVLTPKKRGQVHLIEDPVKMPSHFPSPP